MRHPFHFRETERATLLAALGQCRRACVQASSETLFDDKQVHNGCASLLAALDDLAEMLTGDRGHFWAKLHTSPPTGH